MTPESGTEAPTSRIQVFIPTFNRAERLRRAIDSVLGQSWPGVEVVVLDNHSTDATAEMLASLYTDNSRVQHIRHDANIGMIANFNAIAGRIDADFFSVLTDDDTYEPGFVATAMRHFGRHPDIGLVACNAPTRVHGVVKGSQLDYWDEGYYRAGSGVFRCLLGHYPLITNCLFRRDLRDVFHFYPEMGNTGDGLILTTAFASHAAYVSREISGYWDNDGDNASSRQAFDAVLLTWIALFEYDQYRQLVRDKRMGRRWLPLAWLKRSLTVLVTADRYGYVALREATGFDAAFGAGTRLLLRAAAALRLVRLFTWILALARRAARRDAVTGSTPHVR